jgi:hypothetical protein
MPPPRLALPACLLLALSAAACGDATTPPGGAATVRLVPEAVTIDVGDTVRFGAAPLDRSGRSVPGAVVSWTSSDTSVLRIGADGVARGLRPGSARVVAGSGQATAEAAAEVLPVPRLVLPARRIVADRLGAVVPVAGTIRGEAAGKLSFAVLSEERWLDDHPVLREPTLETGIVLAIAPGRARLLVGVAGRTVIPDTLELEVWPARPVVLVVAARPAVEDGPVRVRGFRADEIGTVRTEPGGLAARQVAADSANLWLLPAPLPAGACAGTAEATLTFEAGLVEVRAPALRIYAPREGDIALGVGAARRLTPQQANCLRLAPRPDAAYAVAWYDPQYSNAARTSGFRPYQNTNVITVSVRDVSALAPTSALKAGGGSTAEPAVMRRPPTAAAASHAVTTAGGESRHRQPVWEPAPAGSVGSRPDERDRPWTLGETFTVSPLEGGTLQARVAAILDSHFVVAVPVASFDSLTPAILARYDSVGLVFRTHAEPLYRHVLRDARPVSSAASGQLLVLVYIDGSRYSVGRASATHIEFRQATNTPFEDLYGVFAHEIAHVWDFSYRRAEAERSGSAFRSSLWITEGLAFLLGSEAIRRFIGVEFLANTRWRELGEPLRSSSLWHEALRGENIERGYSDAGSLLRDLTTRIVERQGTSLDDALRTVLRGGLEGWYGCGLTACSWPGLEGRMRAALGADWNLADGILTYALSQALDDLIPSEVFRNRTFHTARALPGEVGHWRAHATVEPGRGHFAEFLVNAGGTGHLVVTDSIGGTLRLSGSVPLEWKIVRVR